MGFRSSNDSALTPDFAGRFHCELTRLRFAAKGARPAGKRSAGWAKAIARNGTFLYKSMNHGESFPPPAVVP
jgi:hypothetical protein